MAQSDRKPLSYLDHISNLELSGEVPDLRLTGIVCTIGPASKDPATLEKMIDEGMSIARLNFSHGTHEYHSELIKNIKTAVANYEKKGIRKQPVAIAIDTKGSEIRTGVLEGGSTAEVLLEKGNKIVVTTEEQYAKKGSKDIIYVDYKNITGVMKAGSRIYIDDGLLSLICNEITPTRLICTVENGGKLGSCKGVNLPGIKKDLPTISEKDKNDLKFGIQQQVDMVFASFTRNAKEVEEIRKILSPSEIRVIAKIENQEGIDNMNEIIEAADGILIDRGDLGMEISVEKVFMAQKKIIARCMMKAKPIIIATHLLESMVEKPRPTRAESNDVANAVLDGADCVMLSGETAKGLYPVECVRTMATICKQAESASWQRHTFLDLVQKNPPPLDIVDTLAISAVEAADNSKSKAIIVMTKTGKSAQLIAKYRPKCPIIAVAKTAPVCRYLYLHRAIFPLFYEGPKPSDWTENVNARIQSAVAYGKHLGVLKTGDSVVIVTGWKQGPGSTNTMAVVTVQ